MICGDDVLLTEIRVKVFESAAFEAEACFGVDALCEREDYATHLFVLCSSLAVASRLAASEWIARRYPSVPIINIRRSTVEANCGGHTLGIQDRPEDLIQLSRNLTTDR